MTAFATPADMIARYDVHTLGDICTDDEDPVTPEKLKTNVKMLTALNSATGRIKAAALRAARYTVADLEGLTGESKEYLKTLTCRVAFWELWQRKPYADDQQRKDVKTLCDEAIEQIRSGDECFEVAAVIAAGHPTIETVSRVEIQQDWSLAVDQARPRFYPQRRSYRQR